jgi:zinc D-Ala-D-Ala carboxypeptidase
MQLSEHFSYEELTRSETAERNGWLNIPSNAEKENLIRLAELLEKVKAAVGGKPVMINSAYR